MSLFGLNAAEAIICMATFVGQCVRLPSHISSAQLRRYLAKDWVPAPPMNKNPEHIHTRSANIMLGCYCSDSYIRLARHASAGACC